MSLSIYDQVIGPALRGLANLDNMLSIAEKHAKKEGIEPEIITQARLFPSMLPLVFQVRVATDIVKGAAARLSRSEIPKWADEEVTFADLHERIKKATDYLGTFKASQFDGAEKRSVELTLRQQKVLFSGSDYITAFVIPNFYFHISIAYAILRHNGVRLGKADFLGNIL